MSMSTQAPFVYLPFCMQVEGSPGGAPALQAAPSTTMSTARSVLQAEGWRGLFRGLSVNYMKVRMGRMGCTGRLRHASARREDSIVRDFNVRSLE